MKRFFAFVLTPFFWVLSALTVIGWHPLIIIAKQINEKSFNQVVALGNCLMLVHLRVLGTRINFYDQTEIPPDLPLIIVSNHQSLYDIPLHVWFLRKFAPKFVAKKELAYGFPSASYTLRNDGSALIDRGDSEQALREIRRLGKLIQEENGAACIFPEGTRSRDGNLKRFKSAGLKALLEAAPSAIILPIAINGTWHITKENMLPVPLGIKIDYHVLKPISRDGHSGPEVLARARKQIEAVLDSLN